MNDGRFDYVKYDEMSQRDQENFKHLAIRFEQCIGLLPDGRAKSLAMTKLEECYMWIGKGLRDSQIARNGSAELHESRCNS